MFIFIRCCILLSVLAFGASQNVEQPVRCNITDDLEGECILAQRCPRAKQLLDIKDVKTLRKLICGYDKLDVKVCCVTNRTDEALTFESTTTKPNINRSIDQSDNYPSITPTFAPTKAPTTRVIPSVPTSESTQKSIGAVDREHLPGAFTFSNTQSEAQTTAAFDQSQITKVIPPAAGFGFSTNRMPPINTLPNRNECGRVGISDRIYGGQIAGLDEMPWLARIKYVKNSKEVYACHGSLISNRFVLTAAHCVKDLNITEVRLGEWDTETETDCIGEECSDPPVDVAVENAIIHPYYSKTLLTGDIALLLLATPVKFTAFVQPVCLPDTAYIARQDYDLDSGYVTGGWGRTEYETRAVVKRKLKLNPVAMSTCRLAFPRISDALTSSTICAGGIKGEDSCAGDSGSSLVKMAKENKQPPNWFLFGVTSFGSAKCGTEGQPGLYTRITYHMGWIQETINSN